MYINIVFCNLLNISRHELMLIAKLFVKKQQQQNTTHYFIKIL